MRNEVGRCFRYGGCYPYHPKTLIADSTQARVLQLSDRGAVVSQTTRVFAQPGVGSISLAFLSISPPGGQGNG